MATIGTISGLWRYPVKSLRGERLESLALDERGVVGDRAWGLVDAQGKIASGKPTRRFRKVAGLMHHAARYEGDTPVLVLADGRRVAANDPALCEVVTQIAGDEWHLAREQSVSHFDAGSVHLVTSATLARLTQATGTTVEPERLRPNILLQVADPPGFIEDTWVGRELVIGHVRLRVTLRIVRCVMTNHSQTGLPHRPEILKAIGATNAACSGIYLDVVQPGPLTTGAHVSLN
jgi:uncharacterized protein